MEWLNGRNCCGMVEWSNGGNAGMVARMVEWLPNGRMVEWQERLPTHYFMVHTDNTMTSTTMTPCNRDTLLFWLADRWSAGMQAVTFSVLGVTSWRGKHPKLRPSRIWCFRAGAADRSHAAHIKVWFWGRKMTYRTSRGLSTSGV